MRLCDLLLFTAAFFVAKAHATQPPFAPPQDCEFWEQTGIQVQSGQCRMQATKQPRTSGLFLDIVGEFHYDCYVELGRTNQPWALEIIGELEGQKTAAPIESTRWDEEQRKCVIVLDGGYELESYSSMYGITCQWLAKKPMWQ